MDASFSEELPRRRTSLESIVRPLRTALLILVLARPHRDWSVSTPCILVCDIISR